MKRIYNDDGRMIVPPLDSEHEVSRAMAQITSVMGDLRRQGYTLIDVQTIVTRTACDTARDMATHGI